MNMAHRVARVLCAGLAILLAAGIPPAHADEVDIVGSWMGTAPSSTGAFPPMLDLITFHRDGTVVETRRAYLVNSPVGPLLGSAGHGQWQLTGPRRFAATIRVIYQAAETHPGGLGGQVLAIEKVRFDLRLSRDGNRLIGVVHDDVRDLNGQVIFEGPGTYDVTRIRVEPMP